MKGLRVIVAGIVGGIIMFMWGSLAHMVLPFGEMGIQNLPDEPALVPAMRVSLHERGFYFFPGMEKNATPSQREVWAEKYAAGPRGVLIYDPSPDVAAMDMSMLGIELASNVAAALLAAAILASVGGGIGHRALAGAGLGLISWISIDVSYWNWYRFPTEMIQGSFLTEFLGWLLTGLAIALVLGGKKAKAAGPSAAQGSSAAGATVSGD